MSYTPDNDPSLRFGPTTFIRQAEHLVGLHAEHSEVLRKTGIAGRAIELLDHFLSAPTDHTGLVIGKPAESLVDTCVVDPVAYYCEAGPEDEFGVFFRGFRKGQQLPTGGFRGIGVPVGRVKDSEVTGYYPDFFDDADTREVYALAQQVILEKELGLLPNLNDKHTAIIDPLANPKIG